MDLKEYVTIVPDYPKEGISFKDISTIMDNGKLINIATDEIVKFAKEVGTDIIVGPEARGFHHRLSSCLCTGSRICSCP